MTATSTARTCVVVGLGYIGLPTAVVIAQSGMRVVGVDVNATLVASINAGLCPIVEPGLPQALAALVANGSIVATTTPQSGDVYIIAVPTPFAGGYKPDLTYVNAAVHAIAPVLKQGQLVILESTVPVGTTELVARWIETLRPDLTCSRQGSDSGDILVAHCPERVLPGQILRELTENDRVIGGLSERAGEACRAFYSSFVTGNCVVSDARTAELCKLTENSFRDVNIAFANELAEICAQLQIDVWELISLANLHPRVNILKPGPGVGGHCIAVDPWFIVSEVGEKARLIREARWINSERPRQIVRKVLESVAAGGIRSIGCFGLSYKADVDDFRESPAVEIVSLLAKELQLIGSDVELRVVEPHITDLPDELSHSGVVALVDADAGLASDMILMLVDHREFRAIPRSVVADKVVIDTRGLWAKANQRRPADIVTQARAVAG
ncbi:UDP-N-acetyl-D-mannosamine dehydrogenase [Devosia sp. Root105]|uniref:UDP-N-acetyl-D-mannosamine dehydrogenase n=1 Tax=Devosia sp. Root105 TaxID=1736423 RepID=UPI0006F45A56|nr:UDP-N-acetyl-D-mannosamine dehydrogenase [Devosia sp. Root105]KQU99085.1 UDP-N-acetyl-D-mannosaminuronic acid dehydrogenase [Devosia sp. Root105]